MKAFLRIVRLPNVITAASNSLAGAFCAGVALDRWAVLAGLAVVSMAIYASGILFNDLFDLEEDRRERPDRPLPSGQVGIRSAAVVAVALMAIGVSTGWALGMRTGAVSTLLAAAVLGYDAGLKRTFAGPWVMGICRGANFGLGLALAQSFDLRLLLSVFGYVAYVAGVTYVSRQETYVGRTTGLRTGFSLMVTGIGAVLSLILMKTGFRFEPDRGLVDAWPTLLAMGLLGLLLRSLTARCKAALADPGPATIGGMVKSGVISLPLLDFAQTLSMSGMPKAAVIALLWLGARSAAKRLYTT